MPNHCSLIPPPTLPSDAAPDLRPAREGGVPEISRQPSLPHRWSDLEKERLMAMLEQESLFYWRGPQTELLIERFRKHYPLTHVMPCSSGTAAIHIAVASIGLKAGDEVIIPPITDMGTAIGILYQQGVPVFADVDPHTYNLDPAEVRRKITPRTRAIIVVHLAGNPCAMGELKALAEEFNLVLIEDCAQAWGARWNEQPVGTIGHIGCFSLNDFKHISCGDGGIVATSDPRFGPLLQKYADKAYDRIDRTRMPEFLAPNYRITEPQSAVAAAQIERMSEITRARNHLGTRMGRELTGIPGIQPHEISCESHCTYWFYLMRLTPAGWKCSRDEFAAALKEEGVVAVAGYIPTPVHRYPLFQNHSFFGGTWPIRDLGLTTMDYRNEQCPVAEAILSSCVYLALHQGMDEAYVQGVAKAVRKLSDFYYQDI